MADRPVFSLLAGVKCRHGGARFGGPLLGQSRAVYADDLTTSTPYPLPRYTLSLLQSSMPHGFKVLGLLHRTSKKLISIKLFMLGSTLERIGEKYLFALA